MQAAEFYAAHLDADKRRKESTFVPLLAQDWYEHKKSGKTKQLRPPALRGNLRERIVAAVEEKGWSQAKAAEVFGVSEASVSRYRARVRAGGSLAALPASGGPEKKLRLAEHQAALHRFAR